MKTERVVVVTGAAGGIGRQITKKFLDNGYFACMLDIAEEPIEKAIEEMGSVVTQECYKEKSRFSDYLKNLFK